jgi:hypothetical protein
MTESGQPLTCPRCRSIVHPGDRFCGVCGASIPIPPDATRPQNVPTQGHAPMPVFTSRGNLPLLIGLGVAVVLVLGVSIGTVAALTLLRSEPDNRGAAAPPPATTQEENAGTGDQEATEEAEEAGARDNSKLAGVKELVQAIPQRTMQRGV